MGLLARPDVLQHLAKLTLYYSDPASPSLDGQTLFAGGSLSKLPALNFLAVGPSKQQDPLFAGDVFFQASLEVLKFDQDPFDGSPDLAQLPALHTVHVLGSHSIPRWLERQSSLHLVAFNSRQLHGLDLQQLRCLSLTFKCYNEEPPISIGDLLLLPALQSFGLVEVCINPAGDRCPVSLLGSHKEHQALLRKGRLHLKFPAQLSICDAARGKFIASLRENGHTVVCMCPACCNVDGHPCPML